MHVPFPVGELQWGCQAADITCSPVCAVCCKSTVSDPWQKWMFHPAVSPSPLLSCICLSPAASRLSSLPAAVTAQGLQGFPDCAECSLGVTRAARVGNEHGTVLGPFSSSIHPPARLQEAPAQAQPAALPTVWKRGEGGCTGVPHAEIISATHLQHFTLSQGLLFASEKNPMENTSLKSPPSAPLLHHPSYAQLSFSRSF